MFKQKQKKKKKREGGQHLIKKNNKKKKEKKGATWGPVHKYLCYWQPLIDYFPVFVLVCNYTTCIHVHTTKGLRFALIFFIYLFFLYFQLCLVYLENYIT